MWALSQKEHLIGYAVAHLFRIHQHTHYICRDLTFRSAHAQRLPAYFYSARANQVCAEQQRRKCIRKWSQFVRTLDNVTMVELGNFFAFSLVPHSLLLKRATAIDYCISIGEFSARIVLERSIKVIMLIYADIFNQHARNYQPIRARISHAPIVTFCLLFAIDYGQTDRRIIN